MSTSAASTWLAAGLIAGCGGLIRIYDLAGQSLWMDETTTVWFANLPLGELWGERAYLETNPPLYYTIQKAWLVWGSSDFAIRLLPVLIGTASILLVYGLGSALGGPAVGLLSAALIATSHWHVIYSREARTYILLFASALIMVWALLRLMTDPAAWKRFGLTWAAYTVATIVALYLHNTAVILVASLNLIVVLWWARTPDRAFAVNWILSHLAVLATWSWWLPSLTHQSVVALSDFWIPDITLEHVLFTIRWAYGHNRLGAWQPWPDIALGAVALVGIWHWRNQPLRIALTAGVLVVALTLTALLSVWRPIFIDRVLFWPLPLFMILIAAGCHALPRHLASLAAVGLITINVVQTVDLLRNQKRENWREAARIVTDEGRDGDAIAFAPAEAEIAFNWYYPGLLPQFGLLQPPPEQSHAPWYRWKPGLEPVPLEAVQERFRGFDRVWLVARIPEQLSRQRAVLQPLFSSRLRLRGWNLEGVEVYLLGRQGERSP